VLVFTSAFKYAHKQCSTTIHSSAARRRNVSVFGLESQAMDLLTRPQPSNNFKPPVESKVLRQRSDKQGIRLVSYPSLISYLERLPVEVKGKK
jgi:hypothetical protein